MTEKISPTPGPWPMQRTGDGKRIIIGKGLVEGPNGYEVAEVYSDDCPYELAEANARLIAAAPDLLAAVKELVNWWEIDGGNLDRSLSTALAAISKAEG